MNKKSSKKPTKTQQESDKYHRSIWSMEEDEILLNLINTFGCKWKFISKYFKNKTLLEVYNRYFRINPSIKKGRFSEEEDRKILVLINIYGYNWKKISNEFENRSLKQIRSRCKLLLNKFIM